MKFKTPNNKLKKITITMADTRCAEQYHPRSIGHWLRGRADERPSLCQISHGFNA
jgi:hypothetical protein